MQSLRADLEALERPDSELGVAKARWEQAGAELKEVQGKKELVSKKSGAGERQAQGEPTTGAGVRCRPDRFGG